jgi:hypothetical protein
MVVGKRTVSWANEMERNEELRKFVNYYDGENGKTTQRAPDRLA